MFFGSQSNASDDQSADKELQAFKEAARRKGRRKSVPTVLQMEAVECGAAALAMILRYYGRYVPLERLRSECGVSRDGSKASNVLKAARGHGMTAKGYKYSLPKLLDIKMPCIVFWNFNHFVVLEGIRGKKVHINDPAMGPRTLSFEEFDEGYTGVVLAFEPGPEFKKGGERPKDLAGLFRRLSSSKTAVTFVLLATLSLVIPGLVIPIFSKIFVDEILIQNLDNWVMPLLIGMALTGLMRGALTWLQQISLVRLDTKIALTQASAFLWHVFRLPQGFFDQRFAGDILSRVTANDRVATLLSGPLATNLASLPTVIFYLAVMFAFDPFMAMVGAGLALLNVLVLRLLNRVREDGSRRLMQDQGKLAGTSVAGIQLMETLKSSGQEDDFFAKWSGYQAKYLASRQEFSFFTTILGSVPVLVSALITVAILFLGGLRVIDGAMTIGTLVAFQSLMRSFTGPIEQMVNLAGSLQEIKGDLARLDDVLNHELDPRSGVQDEKTPAEAALMKLNGRIELRDVVFGYSKAGPPLINGLSLVIEPGQRVALIGGSGSGKSTVAKLITGLYAPWSGDILFDGKPLSEIPQRVFSQSLSTVDQEIFLFEGSLRDNLSMWDTMVQERDIVNALRDAAILDVIEARAGRYDTQVSEMGANYSGGQRQRIEIARALTVNPSILVLDEATAALDPIVEKQIDDNVRRRGCTSVVVAHRLSTVRDSDEIIVLSQGSAVQRGIHEEMIEQDGPYRSLMQAE
ncbi:NHLP family bacteriocin export ABC transporter peptidase/permease/ATPase subunit [Ruegeria haliotis]|nr:NHLP family bacteriocin export ABC transporter peptidase/permease/ATPase subunit [Ruegeria haliotis]